MPDTPTSRKLVAYQLVSLDSVAEEPGDWFSDGSPDMFANLGEVISTQDDVLLGRGTFDYWVGYWPTADLEPFASFINGVAKHVVTSSEPALEWSNTTLVTTPPADYVADLKRREGGDIGIHGSITLVQSLLRTGLIDELRLAVAPVLAGRGRRLFPDDSDRSALELAHVERSPKGTLFLTYRRTPGATVR